MFRTILVFSCLGIIMVLTILLFIPYFILWLFWRKTLLRRYILFISSAWARHVIWLTGSKVEITGLQHIPEENNLCIISNHQGMVDILLVIGYIPKIVGFMAKKELMWLPIMSFWMKVLGCIFIDRGNRIKTIESIKAGVERIKQGKPILIFPEGTRSKGPKMGQFKVGALNLAMRSKAIIVPITINGSYKVFEEKKRISPARLSIKVHPPVDLGTQKEIDKYKMAEQLWKQVNSGLP